MYDWNCRYILVIDIRQYCYSSISSKKDIDHMEGVLSDLVWSKIESVIDPLDQHFNLVWDL